MANNIAGYPYILDTVAADIVLGTIYIAKIRWVGATTAGHAATITDGNDRVIWTSLAGGASYVEADTWVPTNPLKCIGSTTTGLSISVLGSGVLYIYLS